jgi:aerobic C4-dicarboxylate transport protein
MSEARAVTNFAGNAIATVLIATWTRELDRVQLTAALSGRSPFDESTMLDPHDADDLRDGSAPAPDGAPRTTAPGQAAAVGAAV